MEILVNGNKKQSLIFGCWDCGCIFIANSDEYTYNSYVGRSYCDCPECGAQSAGTELNCSLCDLIDDCDFVGIKSNCCASHLRKVNKTKLWIRLGYLKEVK